MVMLVVLLVLFLLTVMRLMRWLILGGMHDLTNSLGRASRASKACVCTKIEVPACSEITKTRPNPLSHSQPIHQVKIGDLGLSRGIAVDFSGEVGKCLPAMNGLSLTCLCVVPPGPAPSGRAPHRVRGHPLVCMGTSLRLPRRPFSVIAGLALLAEQVRRRLKCSCRCRASQVSCARSAAGKIQVWASRPVHCDQGANRSILFDADPLCGSTAPARPNALIAANPPKHMQQGSPTLMTFEARSRVGNYTGLCQAES